MTSRLRDLDTRAQVLEPSGGDGVFVRSLLRRHLDPSQVDVWDVDPSVAGAVEALDVQFCCHDSLLDAPDEPRYTHVVGNPPYLNKQSGYVRANRGLLRARYADIGLSDTYAMFLLMALRQLRPGGQVSLLVSNTFLTLGIHRKLRELLTQSVRMDEVVLLPDGLFDDAKVHTAVITVSKTRPAHDHQVLFWDLSATAPGTYVGGAKHLVPQAELASNPAATFAYTPTARQAMALLSAAPAKLVDVVDGGLGMFTRDNSVHLRVVAHAGTGPLAPVPAGQDALEVDAVDDVTWKAYHKRGGMKAWWGPAEHAVAWDERSRARYGIPTTAQAGTDAHGHARQGVVISGVAERFTARLATPGAMWESNKCFALFPKDPAELDAFALLAVLNSSLYGQLASALNHTVSLQWRDVAALPWFTYTPAELEQLSTLGARAVQIVRSGATVPAAHQVCIDAIISAAARRTMLRRATIRTR